MNNHAKKNAEILSAADSKEVEEVQRFRYQVYAEEMGLDLPGVDHRRKVLEDPLDIGATHLFARLGRELVGAVRLNMNVVPKGIEGFLQTASLPRPFVYCSRLFVRKTWRGGGIMNDLAKACFAYFFQHEAAVAICHCYPHLLNLYAKLGFRPYGAPFVVAGLEQLGAQTPLQKMLIRQQSREAA